jgi:sugar O-acyltransferase (sialic acid O-acetyltransferase NeuD family)
LAKLILFGAGDMARTAHFHFTRAGEHRVTAFAVDRDYRQAGTFLDLPLVDFETMAREYTPAEFKMFIAVGYRNMAKAMGYELVSHISAQSSYQSEFPPGDNCLILENVIVEPGAKIGRDVTIWSGSWIAHDTVVEDHCFVSGQAAIAGHCRVGTHSFVGAGAAVRDGLTLGPRTLLGAGGVVVRDTEPDSVYVSPAATRLDKTSDRANL